MSNITITSGGVTVASNVATERIAGVMAQALSNATDSTVVVEMPSYFITHFPVIF